MAAGDSAGCEPAAFETAMFFQCFERVGGTCGLVTATVADVAGKCQAIGADRKGANIGEGCHEVGITGRAGFGNGLVVG